MSDPILKNSFFLASMLIAIGCRGKSNHEEFALEICSANPSFSERFGSIQYLGNTKDFYYSTFDRSFIALFRHAHGDLIPSNTTCKKENCDTDIEFAKSDYKVLSDMPEKWGISTITRHKTDSVIAISTYNGRSFFIGRNSGKYLSTGEITTIEISKVCRIQVLQ